MQVGRISDSLFGSGWEGEFSTLKQKTRIRLGFLHERNAKGELQYYHHLIGEGVAPEVIGPFDKPCEFTPRALAESADGSGVISVYACAPSVEKEIELASDEHRPVRAHVTVKSMKLSEDENALEIVASILGNEVVYRLNRQVLPREAVVDQKTLRDWVVN